MNHKINVKRDIQYKVLQGCYWMLYGLYSTYTTVFLLSHGFSASVIGVIVAVSNGLAAAGQMTIGTMVDKYASLTWKKMILIFSGLEAVCLILLAVFKSSMLINGIFFPALMLFVLFNMPMVNAALFYYESIGDHIDFGSARGIGSVAYAAMCFVVGQVVVKFGEQSILAAGAVLLIAFTAITLIMPCSAGQSHSDGLSGKKTAQGTSTDNFADFIKKYPGFIISILGVVLVLSFHTIFHTYMIQLIESLGGDSATMGTTFSIEALAELPVMFGFAFLIKRFSSKRLMMFAGLAFVVKAGAYIMAGSIMTIYLTQILQMFSYAIFASSSVYYANDAVDEADKVKGQSYMTAAISIGSLLGNLTGGFVYDGFGLRALLLYGFVLALAGAAVIIIGASKVKDASVVIQ